MLSFSRMAAILSETELEDTLLSLRSTSKGQLRYNGDWQIDAGISEQLSCSFESFMNEPNDSLMAINASLVALTLKDEYNSSSDSESETSSQPEVSDIDKKMMNPLGIPINFESGNELSIKQYHDDCRENAESRKVERARTLERRMKNLRKDSEQILRDSQEYLAEERQVFEYEIEERQRQDAKELCRRKHELDEQAKEHKRKLDEIYTRSLIEESRLAKQEEMRAVLENLKQNIISLYHQVLVNIEVIQQQFNDSKHMSFVDAQVHEDILSVLTGITQKAEGVVSRCGALHELSVAEDYLHFMNKLIQATLAINNKVTNTLKQAQEKAALKKRELEEKQEQQRKVEADRIHLEEGKQEQQMKLHNDKKLFEKASELKNDAIKQQTSSETDLKSSEHKFVQFISTNALLEYTKLQEHLSKVQASYKEFTSDPRQTKYKFDLQKAVNIPINALSAHSPSQLNDKIFRLVTLLAGENVEVGSKRVNCKAHPSAMLFCKDLVAKKLVIQGAQQVSSNPSSAFLYAAVIVGIWSAFPDIGELILAHFHRMYPYLVPYYMPQIEGQSTNDYHKALGYAVNNDKIEDENHFLKKFSGTVQLYAAVLSSKGATTPDHPHGIDKGWIWLARTLNLKPHPSVTATMLFEFIKVAGHLLMERYRKQFQKLLLMLCKDFIPTIEKVTPPEKQGPTQRLKDFLQDCIKSQQISVPKGYLTEQWWQSGHF